MMMLSPVALPFITVMVKIPAMIIRPMLLLKTSMIVLIIHLIMIVPMPFGILIISSAGILLFKVYLNLDLRRDRVRNKASADDHGQNK